MIRYVVSAVLAVALVGASLPAVEDAAAERTTSDLQRFGADLERTAATLRTEADPVVADAGGARRTLSLSLPRGSLAAAPVRFVALCPSTHGRTVLRYTIGSRPPVTHRLSTTLRVQGGGIRFTDPGEHTLVLGYRATRAGATVTVSAREGSSRGTRPSAACDSSTASAGTTPRGAGVRRPSGPRGTRPTRT